MSFQAHLDAVEDTGKSPDELLAETAQRGYRPDESTPPRLGGKANLDHAAGPTARSMP